MTDEEKHQQQKSDSLKYLLTHQLAASTATLIEPLSDAEISLLDEALTARKTARENISIGKNAVCGLHPNLENSAIFGNYIVGGEDGNTLEELSIAEISILREGSKLLEESGKAIEAARQFIAKKHGFVRIEGRVFYNRFEILGRFIIFTDF